MNARIALVLGMMLAAWPVLGQDQSLKVGLTFRGADSQVRYRDTQLIVNQDQWNRLWSRHLATPVGKPKAPAIDFSKNVIVAVFGGPTWNSEGFEFVEATDQEARVLVRIQAIRYQVVGDSHRSAPFGFFVLPRVAKPYRVEENVQNLIGQPPIWKQRADLLAPPSR